MLLCLLTGNAFANFITYDAKTQFDGSVNGVGGNWRYGYSSTTTSSLVNFTAANYFSNGFATGFRINSDYTPGVWKVNSDQFGANTGDFVIHPGRVPETGNPADEQFGVIRFVAPTAGVYNLNLSWRRKGTSEQTGDDIRVYVSRSGAGMLVDDTYDYLELGSYTSNGLNLAANEEIDLRIGGLGQRNGDVTAVVFTVTAVPEPSSLACVSGLVAGLSVLSRRRRQA
jgi:hypothetical protein